MNLTRRTLLTGSAAAAVASFFGSQQAFASVEELNKAISEFTGGAEPGEGPVTLITPEIAENGNSVPVSVLVESPMTEDDHVQSVMILAEDNPLPNVATFHFSAMSGEARASTRMRLAKTQNVVAVAKMSNGDVYKVSNNVKVTIGGCGG
jgi:sulfur-oxidizing protein SoxY